MYPELKHFAEETAKIEELTNILEASHLNGFEKMLLALIIKQRLLKLKKEVAEFKKKYPEMC